jgi:hypothetical protein
MKQLPVILSVTMILAVIVGVFVVSAGYVASHQAAWQMEAAAGAVANTQLHAVEATEAAKRAVWFTDFYRVLFIGSLVVAVGGAGVYYWKQYDERRESWARAVDGSFALSTFKNAQGQMYVTDVNKAAFGVFGFNKTTGELTTDSLMIGPDRQLDYVKSVQKTRTASATSGADGVRNSAQAKLAAGYYDRPDRQDYRVVQAEPEQLTVAPWQPLTLADAFAQSTADRWLLGQNATGACEFSIMDAQHVGILGAQGTGKTSSTATLMMLHALKSQYHVIALDGKSGVDWMRYKNHIEVYPTDYSVIGDQINELYRAYTMRLKALSLAGASDIYELDYQMKPVVVFLEEFGATMDLLKGESSSQHKAVELQIKEIFRKGRATGIHLVLIDQLMNGWPGVMKANTKGIIAYKIGGQQGAAFNAYKLHELADKGQFWNNGGVYDAWFTKPEAETLLRKLQPSRTKLLTDVQYSVIDDTSIDTRGEGRGEKPPPKHDTSINTSTEFTPVDDTSINTSYDTSDTGDTGIKQPLLVGKPVSSKDKHTVRNVHAMTKSINETCRLVWGAKTPSRAQWVKEVLANEVQQ